MKKLLCRIFGHKIYRNDPPTEVIYGVLDFRSVCTRCGHHKLSTLRINGVSRAESEFVESWYKLGHQIRRVRISPKESIPE